MMEGKRTGNGGGKEGKGSGKRGGREGKRERWASTLPCISFVQLPPCPAYSLLREIGRHPPCPAVVRERLRVP